MFFLYSFFFFFNDTATTEIYTLSLHDALPIWRGSWITCVRFWPPLPAPVATAISIAGASLPLDRKSTRLNSSHLVISYAVFCLKKKKNQSIHLLNIHYCIVSHIQETVLLSTSL